MAREFAQIKLAIWSDDDWRDLSPLARYLYLTILTSPTLTHCGVADWRPARIGAVNGMSVDSIEESGDELTRGLYVVIDRDSEEVMIRSFLRNDGLMKQPKMAVAMASAHAGTASVAIRGVIVHEARRLHQDFPDLKGWGADVARELLGKRSVDPSTYPLGKGFVKGSVKGKATPNGEGSTKGSPTPSPTPTPNTSILSPSESGDPEADTSADTDAFQEFWDAYDKKVKRADAEKKWAKAIKKADPDHIVAAAAEFVTWERANNQGGRFIPDPSSWLNGERWRDERKSPAKPQTNTQAHLALVEQIAAEERAERIDSHLQIGQIR